MTDTARLIVWCEIRCLPPRERMLMRLLFGFGVYAPHDFADAAAGIGASLADAKQVRSEAISHLRLAVR